MVYSQVGKAIVFDTMINGSNPFIPKIGFQYTKLYF